MTYRVVDWFPGRNEREVVCSTEHKGTFEVAVPDKLIEIGNSGWFRVQVFKQCHLIEVLFVWEG